MILSLLFDKDERSKIELFAGAYLDRSNEDCADIEPLLKNVLKYAHWKSFRIKDKREHEEREIRLKANSEIFAEVGETFSLKSF